MVKIVSSVVMNAEKDITKRMHFEVTKIMALARHRPKEQRQYLYRKLRKTGVSPAHASRVRDWTTSHIDLFLMTNYNKKIKYKIKIIGIYQGKI